MTPTEEDLFYRSRLKDQIHLLRTAIEAMKNGDIVQALTVSTAIRVLLHSTAKSIPLLARLMPNYGELRIRGWRRNPSNSVMNLPICATISTQAPHLRLSYDESSQDTVEYGLSSWWSDPFIRVPDAGQFSRKEVILGLANKEGAHVDADMSAAYRRLLDSRFVRLQANGFNVDSLNISRLLAGSSGAQLLSAVEQNLLK